MQRPNGMVTAAAILSLITGGVEVLVAVLYAVVGFDAGVFHTFDLTAGKSRLDPLSLMPFIYVIGCGLLWLGVGIGLLKLQRWAAVVAIVLTGLSFVAVSPGVALVPALIILALVLINWKAFSIKPS